MTRNNEARFILESHDPNRELRDIWDKVKAAASPQMVARLTEARKQFPDIPFDEDLASNAAVLRHVLQTYLTQTTKGSQ